MLRTWPLLLLLGCPAPSDTAAPHPTPPPDTGDTPRPAIVVEALPSLACADPATRISAGPFATYEAGDWGEQPFDPPRDHFVMGSGLAVGDLDDDGWNDIVVPRRTGLELYLGDGAGGLVEHSLPDVGEGGVGAAVVDFDGDGDLDVYLSQYQAHDRLLVNEGGARFRDGTAEAGIGEHPYGVGSSWADFDLDGDLDLLVLEHGNWLIVKSVESHLYENLGDGTFARMEGVFSGLDGYGHTLAGGFLDLDHDALPDLYLVNDYGWIRPNHGFTNRGDGVFETVPPAMGLDLRVCGMGLAATDLNGDDLPDLFMPSWTELRLLQSYEGIGWVDTTATSGITASTDDGRHVAWGSDFGDVDNDGDEDLIVGFGFIPANIPNPVAQPDALYLQQEGAFVEVSQLFGVADPGVTRGTLLVDVDGDGWLDLVKRNRNAPAVLRPRAAVSGSWLGVQLFDETSANTRGVGATIRVQALGRSLSRVVRAGGRSLASGGPPEVHFGLDGVEVVTLEIEWPDGRHDVLEDVPARQRVRVRRLGMTGGPGFDPVDALDRELVALTHPPDWVNPVPDGRYNLVAVGGGTAGLVAAIGAARLGGRVALIEGGLMGGDCLSWGCVPSKALLASARAAQAARDAGRYGVRTGPVEVDFAAVMARMRQLRTHIAHHDSFERVRGEGVDTYRGMAHFTGPDTLEVGGATLTFARAVVATGARAAIPDVPGLADVAPLTNETVFQLDALPTHLLVLGAGPVGCELGQAFRRFGSDVTLVEQAPRVLPAEDPDASAVLEARLTREGVQVLTSAAVERFAAGSATVRVGGEVREVPFDRVLVAAGRTPNVAGSGSKRPGSRWDAAGVHTNAWLQTDNPRIYASGDVAAGVPRLTHAADETSRRVLRNALFFGRQSREDMVIPRVTYTEPEVAHVGADAGSEVHRYAFAEVDRAILDGDTEGFVKVVVDGGIVVGGTVVGAHAGELIGLLSVAVTSRMPVARLSEAVQPYPTRVDALRRAAFASQQARLGPTARETLATLLRWRR